MRICELKQKEVINICTCKNLGCPTDIDFNPKNGHIHSIVIPGPGKLCSFLGRDSEYVIPWECIRQIGDDIILMEIREEECLHKD